MSGGAHDEDVPCKGMVLRELGYALVLGLAGGMAWKTWQWNDKARRVENNNAWDKYYPIYAQQVKADLEAADAAEAEEAAGEVDIPEEQADNEERPTSRDADVDKDTQQPLPLEKKEEDKQIVSKYDQKDL